MLCSNKLRIQLYPELSQHSSSDVELFSTTNRLINVQRPLAKSFLALKLDLTEDFDERHKREKKNCNFMPVNLSQHMMYLNK